MAVNALHSFPSVVERAGLPKGFIGGDFPTFKNTYVAPLDNNPIHKDGMEWAKRYVQARARINTMNARNYDMGGSRNYLPKPQPQGSFFRIQGDSGSNRYGYGMSEDLRGQGGAFRTKPGADYGRRKLRQRGQQLEQMAMEAEMGMPVGLPGTQVPVPLDEQETKNVALDLAMSSIVANYTSGTWDEIKEDEISKVFNTLRTDGLKLPYTDLKEYYDDFINIATSLRDEDDGEDERKIPKAKGLGLYRIFLILAVLLSSINLDEKARKAYLSSQVKRILKVRSYDEEPLTDLPPRVLDVSRGRLPRRVAEEEAEEEPEMVAPMPPPMPSMVPMGEEAEEGVEEGEEEAEEGVEEVEGAEASATSAVAPLSGELPVFRQITNADKALYVRVRKQALERVFADVRRVLERTGRSSFNASAKADVLNQRFEAYYVEELAKAGFRPQRPPSFRLFDKSSRDILPTDTYAKWSKRG